MALPEDLRFVLTLSEGSQQAEGEHMPWIDYEGLSRPKKMLVWVAIVVLAIAVATILWFLGIRPDEVPVRP